MTNNIKRNNLGFSLIEIMIAILIGMIMSAALISLFTNFSNMNRAQNGLARIQENGRYVTMRMKKDIENVGFQPCASISMDSPQMIDKGFATKPMINFSTLNNGLPNALVGDVAAVVDTSYFIQGHECSGSTCSPVLKTSKGSDPYGKIPAVGITNGSRAKGTDVLTVRYLAAEAVNVDDSSTASTDSEFSLAQNASVAPLSLEVGDNILLANCYNALIIPVKSISGSRVEVPVITGASVKWASKGSISSVYNFTKDFITVSYYVGFKTDPSNSAKVISSLYRIENGNAPQELVEGVERFDLTYGAQYGDGTIAYLTAAEMNATTITPATDCIVEPLVPTEFGLANIVNGSGCMWRSVFAVKVNVLLNTVYNSATSKTESFVYSVDSMDSQTPGTVLPSGVDPGMMYRKEFTATISLQSNNL